MSISTVIQPLATAPFMEPWRVEGSDLDRLRTSPDVRYHIHGAVRHAQAGKWGAAGNDCASAVWRLVELVYRSQAWSTRLRGMPTEVFLTDTIDRNGRSAPGAHRSVCRHLMPDGKTTSWAEPGACLAAACTAVNARDPLSAAVWLGTTAVICRARAGQDPTGCITGLDEQAGSGVRIAAIPRLPDLRAMDAAAAVHQTMATPATAIVVLRPHRQTLASWIDRTTMTWTPTAPAWSLYTGIRPQVEDLARLLAHMDTP